MSMTHTPPIRKNEIHQKLEDMLAFLDTSFKNGTALHEVEHGLWKKLLDMGHLCLGYLLALHGSGDIGATVTLPTGEEEQRLQELHRRRYVSIFGVFHLERTVYGTAEDVIARVSEYTSYGLDKFVLWPIATPDAWAKQVELVGSEIANHYMKAAA